MSNQGFSGFAPELREFLLGLERNNDKNWFDAHRRDYERLWLEPSKQFVAALGSELRSEYPGVVAEPRVNGSIMRVNRDTRFAKDKTPYKTALHFVFPLTPAGREGPSLYMKIGARESGFAAGIHGFSPAQLARYREAVGDPKTARALRAALAKVEDAGGDPPVPDLKKVPRGYEADHPAADLLRFKSMFAGAMTATPKAVFGSGAAAECRKRFAPFKPLQRWLMAHTEVNM